MFTHTESPHYLSSARLNEGAMPIIAKLMLRKYMLYLQIYQLPSQQIKYILKLIFYY